MSQYAYSNIEYQCPKCKSWFLRIELNESYYYCESCGEHPIYVCKVCPSDVIVIDCVFDYLNVARERIVKITESNESNESLGVNI